MLGFLVDKLFSIIPIFTDRLLLLLGRISLLFLFLVVISFPFVLLVYKPLLFYYLLNYVEIIIIEVLADDERQLLANDVQVAEKEWRLYQFEWRYGQRWCKDNNIKSRPDWTWLTAMVNDDYAVPALVLGYSLQKLSCQRNMLALVSKDVSNSAKEALEKVGWTVKVVERLDCDWIERQKGLPESHMGYIGTHTRLHAWNYTQYSKIIYADPDYMPMTRIDELFEIDGDFAASSCSRPGILDPCFNAGLLVFRPGIKYYNEIMDLWWKTTDDHCPNDQVLLWHYYVNAGKWTQLPYSYNVRRLVFRPMKAYHFACCIPPKPWSAKCRPNRREAKMYDKPITEVESLAIIFWKILYEVLEERRIDDWWKTTRFYREKQEYGKVTAAQCWGTSKKFVRNGSLS